MNVQVVFKDVFGENNQLIYTTGAGASRGFSCFISKNIPNLHFLDSGQGFYRYNNASSDGLFDNNSNISESLAQQLELSEDDVFYYVYGVLNLSEYQEKYANDLQKALPRIPLLKNKEKFVEIGRKLADLHLNYEHQPSWEGVTISGEDLGNFKVKKMKHPKKGQLDTIVFNESITISNIPEQAYEYIVNGRPAIEWIIDQYQIKTDKKSGITDDPNEFAPENLRYILDLLLSVITVSMRTVELVAQLPEMEVVE